MKNENIDLTKILKDCPKGTKFYTTAWGEVAFVKVKKYDTYSIHVEEDNNYICLTKKGCYTTKTDAECLLFPSRDQRDWSKFTALWYKKGKFDPKTLQPYDKVLVRDNSSQYWECQFFSYIIKDEYVYPYVCVYGSYVYCIPYNDETKHLIGTMDEAPEYYRYWED